MGRRRDYKSQGKAQSRKSWTTTDGFDSFAAKLGQGQDNMLARSGYAPGNYLTKNQVELDDMYRTAWVVGRMVEVVAEDMIRGGVTLSGLDSGDTSKMERAMRGRGVPGRLTDAIKWGRLYGGALAVILIDGHDLATPLEMDDIQQGSFRGLHVLDRHQVTPSNTDLISDLGPMLGYPAYYTLNTPPLNGNHVHHSRVIRSVGVNLPYRQRIAEQHWGASVVERVFERILALDSATLGAANLFYKSFLRVLRVKDYRLALSNGGKSETAVVKMFENIRRMQTNEGLTVIDKEDEFGTHGWSFGGVYDGLQAFSEQISGASGIPLVRLLGQSPKGFSGGDSDLRGYYDNMATQQEDDLRSPHNTLYNVQSRSLWGRPLPEDFNFSYRYLWVPTDLEKSQIATADAQNVAGLYTAGVIDHPQSLSELRESGRITGRWGGISDKDIKAAETAASSAPDLPDMSESGSGANVVNNESETHTPQEVSLNGAQVQSMVQIVSSVGSGQLPRESGVQMLMAAFPVDRTQAEKIMGEVGKGFVPTAPGVSGVNPSI